MRGGYGTSDHGTLADRRGSASAAREPTSPVSAASPARHCQVDGEPSLLVEWRRSAGGWEGRVISMVWVHGVGWATVERWLPTSAIDRP